MKSVLVVDYGAGNLGSISAALEDAGASVSISAAPEAVKAATRIVIPGVGNFASAMAELHRTGQSAELVESIVVRQIPCLAVCLGMQLLCETGTEGGEVRGLGILRGGRCTRMTAVRLPHTGWNELDGMDRHRDCPVFEGTNGKCVYFNHSYAVNGLWSGVAASVTYEGKSYVAAVCMENVVGLQWHPERSLAVGERVLKNWVEA